MGAAEYPACPGLRVDGQREEDVLWSDVGGPERPRDLMRVQQRTLGPGRQGRRRTAPAGVGSAMRLLGRPGYSSWISTRPGEQLAGRLHRGCGPQQVLGVQFAASLCRLGGCRANQLTGGPAHQPGDVDPVARGWPACGGPEYPRDEVVEGTARLARRPEVTTAHRMPPRWQAGRAVSLEVRTWP